MTRLQHFTARTAEGEEVSLADLAGKATLVVNLASKCGLTPQLDGLQALQEEYEERGLRIIGFPCDQFGGQMPGTDEEAVTFCRTEYGVTFPVLAKVGGYVTAVNALENQSVKEGATVVQIDDAEIGTGKPGPVAARLREIYLEESRKSAI